MFELYSTDTGQLVAHNGSDWVDTCSNALFLVRDEQRRRRSTS